MVPGHEIVGVVTKVGPDVSKFKVGDFAAVGCLVDSCGGCKKCEKSEEQYCPSLVATYNATCAPTLQSVASALYLGLAWLNTPISVPL